MRIAVLALQGAFIEHEEMLKKLDVEVLEIRQKKDLEQHFDGLILPGGESTVQGKLLKELNLFEPLQNMILNGMPVYGTCAGLVLLAKTIDNDSKRHFSTMNIEIVRNAYGRQLGSFFTNADFKNIGTIPMTFIRAPYIKKVSDTVEILATVDNKIVAAKEKNQLVTSFHPEITNDLSVHKYFVEMVKNHLNKKSSC